MDLPRQYDKRYRINIGLPPRNIDQHLKEQKRRGESLTRVRVSQFKQILLHYLDFAQKQKVKQRYILISVFILHSFSNITLTAAWPFFIFYIVQYNKLVKIRKDQQNLPIFQYKEKIIEAVRQYQVVVVAGDTGCGKSTQVVYFSELPQKLDETTIWHPLRWELMDPPPYILDL